MCQDTHQRKAFIRRGVAVDRIREGSTGRMVMILLAATLIVGSFAGCRKEIPEEKARAIFTEIAGELVKRDDAEDAAKSAIVDAVCEKNGFVRKDIEYLIKTNPTAKEWLAEALKVEIKRDLDEQRDLWEKRLAKARQNNEENVAHLDTDQAAKFEKVTAESRRRMDALDQEYKVREKAVQERIDAIMKELKK